MCLRPDSTMCLRPNDWGCRRATVARDDAELAQARIALVAGRAQAARISRIPSPSPRWWVGCHPLRPAFTASSFASPAGDSARSSRASQGALPSGPARAGDPRLDQPRIPGSAAVVCLPARPRGPRELQSARQQAGSPIRRGCAGPPPTAAAAAAGHHRRPSRPLASLSWRRARGGGSSRGQTDETEGPRRVPPNRAAGTQPA